MADKLPAFAPVNITKPWMRQQRGDGNASLGRMIEEAFPHEESLFRTKENDNDDTELVAAPLGTELKDRENAAAAAGTDSDADSDADADAAEADADADADPDADADDGDGEGEEAHADTHHNLSGPYRVDRQETVARVQENIAIKDLVHPWGFVDYGKLMKYVEANPLDIQSMGLLLMSSNYCRFIIYEHVYSVDPVTCPPRPNLVFARIPLVTKDGFFGKERYILYYKIQDEELRIRFFADPPSDIYEICGVWEEGIDIYCFTLEDLYNLVRDSIDNKSGEMAFPYLDTAKFCFDTSRKDPPGLQLVIVSQCTTFMIKVTRVLLNRQFDDSLQKNRGGLKRAIKLWRSVLERSSHKLWMSSGTSLTKADFVRKMCINGMTSEIMGLMHGKTHKAIRVDSEFSASGSDDSAEECRKAEIRQEEALDRVKRRFEHVFQEPTQEERLSWQTESALESAVAEAAADEKAGHETAGGDRADDVPIHRSEPMDIPRYDKNTVVHRPRRLETADDYQPYARTASRTTTVEVVEPDTGVRETVTVDADADQGTEQSDQDHDQWLNRPPVSTLSDLLSCFLDFIKERPEMDDATNRIRCRTMFADMGVTIAERRGHKPEVTGHPFDGRIRTVEEHAADIAEFKFDIEDLPVGEID